MDNFEKKSINEPVLDTETRSRINSGDKLTSSSGSAEVLNYGATGFWAKNKWFVLVFLLSLAILGVVAVTIFRKPAVEEKPNLLFSIEAPKKVNVGTETVFQFVLENKESRTIEMPKVEVVLPSGATFIEAQPKPENLSGTLYTLENITPGANVVLWMKIKLDGNVGDIKRISAKSSFKLSGVTAEFEVEQTAEVELTSAGLSVNIFGPSSTGNSQPVSYTIRYSNQTKEDYPRARIVLSIPVSFQVALNTPKPNVGNNTWDLSDFKAGSSGEIKVDGSFSASGENYLKFKAELLLPDGSGNFFKQSENEFVTTIGTEPLRISQNVSLGTNNYVFPDDTVNYKLSYQNTSTNAARSVRIVFSFDSSTIDLSSIRAEGGRVSGNEVTWSAASKNSLEVLSPNDSGMVEVFAKVKNPPVNDRTVNPEIKTSVKIISNEYESFLKGNDLAVKIAGVPEFMTALDYVSGSTQLRVGAQTIYKVSLVLTNTTSDLLDSELTAFVPTGAIFNAVSLSGNEAGRVTYDPNSGRITWKVGVLRAYSGTFAPKRQLDFEVEINPSLSQINTTPDILKNISFQGLENYTQRSVKLVVDDITTANYDSSDRVRN